jgi:hypothetical protein
MLPGVSNATSTDNAIEQVLELFDRRRAALAAMGEPTGSGHEALAAAAPSLLPEGTLRLSALVCPHTKLAELASPAGSCFRAPSDPEVDQKCTRTPSRPLCKNNQFAPL